MASMRFQQIANTPYGSIIKSIDQSGLTANLSDDENIFCLMKFRPRLQANDLTFNGDGDDDDGDDKVARRTLGHWADHPHHLHFIAGWGIMAHPDPPPQAGILRAPLSPY